MKLFTILAAIVVLAQHQSNAAEPFKPNLGPDLPFITLKNDNLTILMRQSTQWTPGRIDFRGHAMTTEKSAYGTVFMYPEIGFIGTGHLENEPEEIQSLTFFADKVEVKPPSSEISGKTIKVVRESEIRNFRLTNEIEISDVRLTETVTVKAMKTTPLKLVYHFMHAWTPTVSEYLAGIDGEAPSGEPLPDGVERKFHINGAVDWTAVYEPTSQQFAVSRLLESPPEIKTTSKIWNVPGTYRKYYLQSFYNETVPAGFEGTWKMVTVFGTSEPEKWKMRAKTFAEKIR